MASNPSLRDRKAQLTRDEILAAARRLFAERGYAHTSVREIAAEAGVSTQTVYDSVGSKQALVARLNDLIDAEAGIAELAAEALRSTDPAQVVTLPARICRSIVEHCADILRALVSGAATEPELVEVMAEGHRRHVAGAQATVARLQELGALRADPGEASATLAALADVRFALLLHETYGWSTDRLERWVADASRTLLLAPSGSPTDAVASSSPRRKRSDG